MVIFLIFFTISSLFAQGNDTIVYYKNNTIAIKKQQDSVYFYNSSGVLRKIIDLKNKKVTPFDLPKEVQNIIYNLKIPETIEISEETFPTYLFTQQYTDAGIVLCTKTIFYNKLGLKTGEQEECPDDISDAILKFGSKDLYTYNEFGLLTATKGGFINHYNENGQLTARSYQNKITEKKDTLYRYYYKDNKLSEAIKSESEKNDTKFSYLYNDKGLLTEIIKSNYIKSYYKRRVSIQFEYNNQNKIRKLIEAKVFKKFKSKRALLTYKYDAEQRINNIQIKHNFGETFDDYQYVYDTTGNLITINLNGKVLKKYEYNTNGTLIHIKNNWGREKGFLKYGK